MKLKNARKKSQSSKGVADSIKAAAGITGYSARFLSRLKAMGCMAFRSGRVYLAELNNYIIANALEELQEEVEEIDRMKVAIARERLIGIKFDNEIKRGRYIKKEKISHDVQEIAYQLKYRLRQKLEDELPPLLQGKDINEIRCIMIDTVNQLCALFQNWTKR